VIPIALFLLTSGSGANAAEQGVTGKKLLLKSAPKLVLVSKDPNISNAGSDPVGGADSSVSFDAGGGPVTFSLPKTLWSSSGEVFKYKNQTAPGGPSPVKVAKVKPGLLKVVAKGLPFPVPSGAASIDVVLSLDGGTNTYCMTFSGSGDGTKFLVKDAPAGSCSSPAPTPTATSTPASTSTPTPSPTPTPSAITILDFTTTAPGGICGNTKDSSSVLIENLTCGGLNIGGGDSIVPEAPIPDGATSRFALSCAGSSCTIGPTSVAPAINTAAPDCTHIGCNFGTPLPIPHPSVPSLSLCVQNTWSLPASGTLDLTTGLSSTTVSLVSDVYMTGNLAQPCPRCSATGSPSSPGTGTCDRGPRAGLPCTTTSSTGYTRDCPTGGVGSPGTPCPGSPGSCAPNNCPCTIGGGDCCDGKHIGTINVTLSPLTTGTVSDTDPGGLFCPGQGASQDGCFGSPACRTITENGVPAGPLSSGIPTSATLASLMCISATGNGLVDTTVNLPGPGALTLPGLFTVQ
jgi:hypothetical protein